MTVVTPAAADSFEEKVCLADPFDPALAVGSEFHGKKVVRKATMSIMEFENDLGTYVVTSFDPMPEKPFEPHELPSSFALMIELELEVEGIEKKMTDALMQQAAGRTLNS